MGKRIAAVITAGVVSFAITLSGTNVASASPRVLGAATGASTSVAVPAQGRATAATFAGISQEQIAKFDQYVSYDSVANKFVIAVPPSVQLSDPVGYQTALSAVAEANSGLDQVIGAGAGVRQSGKAVRLLAATASDATPRNGDGDSFIEWYWWGAKIFLSDHFAKEFSRILSGTAAIADLVALFTVATGVGGLTQFAASLISLAAAIIDACNRDGRGIVLVGLYVGPGYCRTR